MDVSNIGGSLSVHDGAGNIVLNTIQGPVSIYDGAGDITANNLASGINLEADTTGSVNLNVDPE